MQITKNLSNYGLKKKGEGTEMELFKLAKVVERVTHKFLTDVCKEANTWCSLASG